MKLKQFKIEHKNDGVKVEYETRSEIYREMNLTTEDITKGQ